MKATLTHVTREERDPETRPLDMALIRRLFTYMRPYARRRNALIAIVVLRSIQLPLLAWAIGAVIGGPVARHDVRGVLWGAAGYALLTGVTQFTMKFRTRLALALGENIVCDLRRELFGHLQRLPMRFYHTTRVGRLISRFTSDIEAVRVGVQDVLFVSLVQIGQMTVAGVIMLLNDPVLFCVILALWPILWAINRYFRQRLSRAYRAVQESFSRITATLAESVNGIRVTQGFARQEVNANLFQDLVADHYQYNLDAARAGGVFIPLLEFNTQLFVAGVLFIGAMRVFSGQADVEGLYQFILMANVFFGPVQSLGTQYNHALAAMAGAERVFKLLDTQPDWSDPPDAIALPGVRGHVAFDRVGFGYVPDRPVLDEISFHADPGQTVALVGHTGSGKSTIVNLIAKFYLADRGVVSVDGCDVRRIGADSLHRHIGIVLQQNFLFTGTVFDNIRYSRPDAPRAEVVRAIQHLGCLDLLEALPDGLNTVVGEKGAGISLGQRQLICFARAMLADPRILLLDEATSSVDSLTEARIQMALQALLRDRTSIVVAHRLSTIRNADLVLVLDRGRIVERGNHTELLKLDGVYADLYRQFVRSVQPSASATASAAPVDGA